MQLSEKELIGRLKNLRQIKPRNNWVLAVKRDILKEDQSASGVFSYWTNFRYSLSSFFAPSMKPVFAPVLAGVFVVLTAAGFMFWSQKALPGDALYGVKRLAERGQIVLVSDEEKSVFELKMANQRLQEITKAPAKNLASTINDFQANISAAAKNLGRIETATTSPIAMRKLVEEAKKLEENKQKAESLGVIISDETTNELNQALKAIAEDLIEDLEKRTLTDSQSEILSQMKKLYEAGNYSETLGLYLINQ